jgi:hypothetical protein
MHQASRTVPLMVSKKGFAPLAVTILLGRTLAALQLRLIAL